MLDWTTIFDNALAKHIPEGSKRQKVVRELAETTEGALLREMARAGGEAATPKVQSTFHSDDRTSDLDALLPPPKAPGLLPAAREATAPSAPKSPPGAMNRPRWESRGDEDEGITPEAFVEKYYAQEKARVTPRPQWTKDGPFGDRPAEFIAIAYAPEMAAGTLHRGVVARDNSDLVVKLASWLRHHEMPPGVDIPTKPDWNTRQLDFLRRHDKPLRPKNTSTPRSRLYDVQRHRAIKP